MSQGTLSQTGNDLDIAIRGEGFFKSRCLMATYTYSRDGSFQMDAQAASSPRRQSGAADDHDPAERLRHHHQRAGPALGHAAGLDHADHRRQIGLTRFINKAGLNPIGDNLFTDTPASARRRTASPTSIGFGDMQQSNLEQANVEVVSEISDLIAPSAPTR